MQTPYFQEKTLIRDRYECPACLESFRSKEALREHRREVHGLVAPLGRSAIGASLTALGFRIYLGTVMIMHGLPKLTEKKEETIENLQKLGVPSTVTILASLLEVIGGIFLVIGLLVPIVSSLFTAEMIGTTILSKEKMGKQFLAGGKKPAYELDVIYAGAFLALAILGAGAFSVDEKLKV